MTALAFVALLAGAPAAASPPARLVNARIEMGSASAGLAGVVKALAAARREPLWVGYAVASGSHGTMCCFNSMRGASRCSGCRLEGDGAFFASSERGPRSDAPILLEASRQALMLYRLAAGRVERVRAFSADCALDAGGLAVVWLTDVAPAESLALLRSLVTGKDDDDALGAIAAHADPGADFVLIELARTGRSADMRGEALVLLAEKASSKAVGEIQRAILEDPETDVKKQAVGALAELPEGQGIPILIELARRHKNPAVREQAFLSLGESEDPRALAFFTEVLTR